RVPRGQRSAVDVQLAAVDAAQRLVQAELLLGEAGVLPRLERGQYLGGERLVDLVEVEVLQAEPRPGQHPRHRVRGRQQQALVPVHVVDRGRLAERQVRQ